ncbi:hypothetical protein SprV_0100096300 [Sparganum proliferum]
MQVMKSKDPLPSEKRLESFTGSGAVVDKATASQKPKVCYRREWPNTLQQCGEMTPALKLRRIRQDPATHSSSSRPKFLLKVTNGLPLQPRSNRLWGSVWRWDIDFGAQSGVWDIDFGAQSGVWDIDFGAQSGVWDIDFGAQSGVWDIDFGAQSGVWDIDFGAQSGVWDMAALDNQ